MPDAALEESGRGARRLALVAAGALVPVALLVAASLWAGRAAIDELTRAASADLALVVRDLVEAELEHTTSALVTVAEAPALVQSSRDRDAARVRARLTSLVAAYPRVVRAFVTTPEGVLWSDAPPAPESLGRSFAHQDWYRGVSRSWAPYVSQVYRRFAAPQPALVAVAVPVREAPGGQVVAIVVAQLELEGLSGLLHEIDLGGEGEVFVVDHAGAVVAHPRLDLQARIHDDYAGAAPVVAARAGAAHGLVYDDPVSGTPMLASAIPCEAGRSRWTVVVQRPLAEARRPVVALAVQTGVAGALALVAAALGLALQERHRRRVTGLVARLHEENAQRRAAEAALVRANEGLEAQVTERTRALEEAQGRLLEARKLEAIGRLAGGVAHDFNNLLTVILGYGELAARALPAGGGPAEAVAQIREAGERARGLTQQLLAFGRKQVLVPRALDLRAVVGGLEPLLRRVLGADVALVVDAAPDLAPARADATQVEQVLVNLAANARDAMSSGGRLEVSLSNATFPAAPDGDPAGAAPAPGDAGRPCVLLRVADTGQGMDAATAARVFEPFFTTKALGQGTGLGLATVYGIVKQSGGEVRVESAPGRGATFSVFLPRAEAEAAAAPAPAPAPPAPAQAGAAILVVEDEDGVRELVRLVLEGAGHDVTCVGSLAAARRVAAARPGGFDLLLADVVLPDGRGPALARELRARAPGLAVLFMSGYTDGALPAPAGDAPALDAPLLAKPLATPELLARVAEALDRRGGPAP